MLTLNIIPNSIKKEIRLSFIGKSLKHLFSLIFFLLIFYGSILIATRFILLDIYKNTSAQASTVTKDTEKYSIRVRNINNELNYLEEIQAENTDWLPLISKFSMLVGPDIHLEKLSLNKEKNILSFSGTATSPEKLLNLKDNLNKSEFLENIDLPLKLLFNKGEVDFNINATISNYEISRH